MTISKINKLIENSGLKQKFVASEIGITKEHLNRVLKSKEPLSADVEEKLTKLLTSK